jgi:outer membrane protein assembly factor BamB
VVTGGRVFAVDYQKAPDEAERVLCLDAVTGKLLWSHRYPVKYGKLEYGNGPRATPAVFDGRVYTLGAVGQLYCLDAATGKVLWSADLVRDYRGRMPGWGFAASPVVVGDLLVMHAGAEPDGGVLALDRRTGKEVWRSLPDEAGYATPSLITARSGPQLVCWTPANVCGLEPRTGKLLWAVPFQVTYGTSIATPIFAEDIVLVSGYWEGARAIRLGDRAGDATPAWSERRRLRALMSQPLYRDGHLFLLDKRDGLVCCELKTGRKLWDDGNRMTPKGRNPQASMVWAGDGDRALVLNSDGELILARLTPRGYQEQARTKIIGPTWAHPAYAGTCVFARDDTEIVCVSLLEGGR